jgi:glycosyltransferase involved in cell wall biosynthesis
VKATPRTSSQRILAVHRYYWPDTPPYASLLRAIVARWTQDGHDVSVMTSQPSYKPETANQPRPSTEVVDSATVRRVAMKPDRSSRLRRAFNVFWFPAVVMARILRDRRYDIVMCSTAPPILLAAAVSWAAERRRAAFIYHCMDLHPEIGAMSGEFASPWIYRLMMRIELSTCRRARAIVVLSEDMRSAIGRRDPVLDEKTIVINNFELPDYGERRVLSPVVHDPSRVRIAFTGNVGRFQGLDRVVEAVLGDEPKLDTFELILMGDGAAKQELQDLVASSPEARRGRVRFLPHGPAAQARAVLQASSLGLVSLAPGVINYAFPSKTATYLSEGLPLLVAVEDGSELAELVVTERIGVRLPDDVAGIRAALLRIAANRSELPDMAVRARFVWERDFSADRVLHRWSDLPAKVKA